MKEFLDVTLLALLQGVAEFLPISSSGHLVVGRHLLGMHGVGMRLDIFLHVGTLVSIGVFYAKHLATLCTGLFAPGASAEQRRSAWSFAGKIVLSALPACAVYFLFHRQVDAMFENAKMVGALLMFTGLVLSGTRLLPRGNRDVSWLRALWMGIMQALALLPGVSRSGMTLAAARAGRIDAEAAAEFSFLMSAPMIAGGAFLDVMKACFGDAPPAVGELSWGVVVYGAVVAAVTGYFSLALLLRALKGKWFWAFGPYCCVVGLLVFVFC